MDDERALVVPTPAVLQGAQVLDLDRRLTLAAAQLSHALQLPVANSSILATGRDHQARLHTMGSDVRAIADVEWLAPTVLEWHGMPTPAAMTPGAAATSLGPRQRGFRRVNRGGGGRGR